MFTFAKKLLYSTLAAAVILAAGVASPHVAYAQQGSGINAGGAGLAAGTSLGAGATSQSTTGPLSLTAVLLEARAATQGIELGDLLADMRSQLGEQSRELYAPGDFQIVNDRLTQFTFGGSDYQDLIKNVLNTASSPDGMAIAGAIAQVRAAGNLQTPTLSMPGVPGGAALLASAGPDELAFGLFTNQLLADMVRNQPNVLAQIQAGGTLSADAQAVFNQSLQNAAATTSQGLASNLISPCYAGMLATLGSGSPGAAAALGVPGDCGACIAAGSYLHNQLTQMLGGNQFLLDPNDGNITQYEWSQMDPNSQQAILRLNPQLQSQLDAMSGGPSGQASTSSACSQASAGTTNYLQSRVGGVLGRLGG